MRKLFAPLTPLPLVGRGAGAGGRAALKIADFGTRPAAPHPNPRRFRGSTPQGAGESRGAHLALLLGLFALLLAACTAPTGPQAKAILAAEPAEKLSAYGLFLDASARQPAEGVVAYDLVNPLFSDHASKHRFVYVPSGQQAKWSDTGVFDFPVGSVLIKTFAFAPDMAKPTTNERYVETRLLIRKADGWVAYPYVWNAEQTEAVYAPVGGRQKIDIVTASGEALSLNYGIPNRNQCKECHQSGKVLEPIGPKARNLHHVGPNGAEQVADWRARGILEAGAQPETIPSAFDAAASLSDRARAYLDVNCAHCHKASGSASNSGLFLDWHETDPTGWGVHKRPTAAGRGAGSHLFVIEPGHPGQSILLHRMESVEPGVMMPELSRTVRDQPGIDLIRDWIAAMPPVQ